MCIDGFAVLCPAKECVALTGLSINNTDSRGVAPCYNISPLQGFYTAPFGRKEITAYAGMTKGAGICGLRARVL
ncbi:MAG: hypothetical protein ACR2P4_03740 [Gammaproteobacteria bacterium]